jgi:hypothetical protein
MLLNDSKRSVSAALLLLSGGLLLISCGVAWQHTLAPLLHLSAAQSDFFHGFGIGLGLALEIAALVMLVRISAARAKQ